MKKVPIVDKAKKDNPIKKAPFFVFAYDNSFMKYNKPIVKITTIIENPHPSSVLFTDEKPFSQGFSAAIVSPPKDEAP